MKHYLEFTVNIKPVQVSQIILDDTELKSNLIFQDYKVAA